MALFSHVCKDCTKRQLHCHASCKEYLEAKEIHDAASAKERAARDAEQKAKRTVYKLKKG